MSGGAGAGAQKAGGAGPASPPALPFPVSPELYPFEHCWLEVDGHRVHYVDEGPTGDAAPRATLLCLHGNPTWSFLYRHLIRELRPELRLVAVDYPGFGLSTPAAGSGYGFTAREHSAVVEGLVDALGLEGLTLFVQDWGGPIGLGLAGRRPDKVARLVIGNTWAWPVDGDPWFGTFSRLLGGRLGERLVVGRNAFVNVLLPAGCTRRRPGPEEMRHYRAPFEAPRTPHPTWVFPREILAARDYLAEVEAGLERIRDRPALLVWGNRDAAFRARERRRFEGLFADHRTVILRGAGHYIQEDAPVEIAAAIRAWLP